MSTPNDKQKSASQLLTDALPALKGSGLLYGQQVRDLIKSLTPSWGSMYESSVDTTSIAEAGTYVKEAGTTTLTGSSSDVSMPVNNRLKYAGEAPRRFLVHAQTAVSLSTGTNQTIGIQVYKYDDSAASGALIVSSEVKSTIAGTDIQEITTIADTTLDTNDYIELWIANHTNTNDVQNDLMSVFMQGLLI